MRVIRSDTTGMMHVSDNGPDSGLTICGRLPRAWSEVCCAYTEVAALEMFSGHADTCNVCLMVLARRAARAAAVSMVNMAVLQHGCWIVEIDLPARVINIDGPSLEAQTDCAEALDRLFSRYAV